MNKEEKQMSFFSSKYNRAQLEKRGVIGFKKITCRSIDLKNPHFINYHLSDLETSGLVKPIHRDTYIIEGGKHDTVAGLSIIEILLFLDINSRDRFVIENKEKFKVTIKEYLTYDSLVLSYMN